MKTQVTDIQVFLQCKRSRKHPSICSCYFGQIAIVSVRW